MRRMLLLAGLVLLMGGVAKAQGDEYSKFEASGDYSFYHTTVTVKTQPTGSGVPTSTHTSLNLNGWSVTAAYNVNKWLGLVADVGGEYGTPTITVMSTKVNVQTHLFDAVFGPQINFRNSTKVTPFVHALVGVSHGNFKVSSGGVSKSESDNAFAGAFGGGLDWNVGEHVSIRLIQAEYFPTHFKSNTQNGARISAGIVFRSGDH